MGLDITACDMAYYHFRKDLEMKGERRNVSIYRCYGETHSFFKGNHFRDST